MVVWPTISAAATPADSEYPATSTTSIRSLGLISMKWFSATRSITVISEATTAIAIIVAARPARATSLLATSAVSPVATVIGPIRARMRTVSLTGRTGSRRRAQ